MPFFEPGDRSVGELFQEMAEAALRSARLFQSPQTQPEPEYPQVQENFWSPDVLAFRSTRHEDRIVDEWFDRDGLLTRRNTTCFYPLNWREVEEYWEEVTEQQFTEIATFGDAEARRVVCTGHEVNRTRRTHPNARSVSSGDRAPSEQVRLEQMRRLVESGRAHIQDLRGLSAERIDELFHESERSHIRRYQRWRIEIPNRDIIYPVGLPTPRSDVSRGDVNPTGSFETVRAMAIAAIELVNFDGDLVNLQLPISNLSIIQARTVDIVATVLSRRIGFDRYGQATIDECAIAGDVMEVSNSSSDPLCRIALRLRVEELRGERGNPEIITFEVPVRGERRRSQLRIPPMRHQTLIVSRGGNAEERSPRVRYQRWTIERQHALLHAYANRSSDPLRVVQFPVIGQITEDVSLARIRFDIAVSRRNVDVDTSDPSGRTVVIDVDGVAIAVTTGRSIHCAGNVCRVSLELDPLDYRITARDEAGIAGVTAVVERPAVPIVRAPSQVWVRSPLEEYWMGSDFSPNPSQSCPTICRSCRNFHGGSYGGNFLVCAIHPYGNSENCTDFEGKGCNEE